MPPCPRYAQASLAIPLHFQNNLRIILGSKQEQFKNTEARQTVGILIKIDAYHAGRLAWKSISK